MLLKSRQFIIWLVKIVFNVYYPDCVSYTIITTKEYNEMFVNNRI